MKSSFTIFAFNQVQISTYNFNQSMINTYKARSQALGYTLWFSLFSLKLNIFPFSASILTFSTQNHLILTYFTQPIVSTNTIISTVNAIRKSKWIISSNKASYEVKRPLHIYTWIHVNAKLFFLSWRTMFVWSGNFQGHVCAGRFTRPCIVHTEFWRLVT
jgi:hypothetical protein